MAERLDLVEWLRPPFLGHWLFAVLFNQVVPPLAELLVVMAERVGTVGAIEGIVAVKLGRPAVDQLLALALAASASKFQPAF